MAPCALGQAEHLRADTDAAFVQRFDGDLVALAGLAENSLARQLAVVEEELAGGGGADAELVFLAADGEAGRALFDEEGGDAAVALCGIEGGKNNEETGFARIGDPELAAIEAVAGAGEFGAGLEREGIGAGAGFRERVGAHCVRGQARQPLVFLGVGGPAAQRVIHQRVVHVDEDGNCRIDGGDGLNGEYSVKEAARRAAHGLRDLDAHDAQLKELLNEAGSELLLVVHGAHQRRNCLFGEAADAGCEQRFFFRELRKRRRVGVGQKICGLRIGSVPKRADSLRGGGLGARVSGRVVWYVSIFNPETPNRDLEHPILCNSMRN